MFKVWRDNDLKAHLVETYKVSRNPKFVEKRGDIIGLYMSAREHALLLYCDETSQMQALDRTQPGLPLKRGRASTVTNDNKRNGTTTLFAALNILDEQVITQSQQRHRHIEWFQFPRQIDRETPKDKALHLICDNDVPHKHPTVQEWLEEHPRFHIHCTPISTNRKIDSKKTKRCTTLNTRARKRDAHLPRARHASPHPLDSQPSARLSNAGRLSATPRGRPAAASASSARTG